jgi:hypothetical protein
MEWSSLQKHPQYPQHCPKTPKRARTALARSRKVITSVHFASILQIFAACSFLRCWCCCSMISCKTRKSAFTPREPQCLNARQESGACSDVLYIEQFRSWLCQTKQHIAGPPNKVRYHETAAVARIVKRQRLIGSSFAPKEPITSTLRVNKSVVM